MNIETGKEMEASSLAIWNLTVVIDFDSCDACEACVNACQSEVLAMVDGQIKVVNEKNCNKCKACVKACPNYSISI